MLVGAVLLATTGVHAQEATQPPPPRDYYEGICADVPRGRFNDVSASDPAAHAIDCLAEFGIIDGYADGSYRPTEGVDRADAAVFLGRSGERLTFEAVFDNNTPPPFKDLIAVSDEEYFYIRGLYNRDVVAGVSNDLYGPDRALIRAQVAGLVNRLHALVREHSLEKPPAGFPPADDYYTDDEGSVHEEAVNEVTAAGVANGVGNATYRPDRGVTRAQMALLLARYLQYVEDTRPRR